MSIIQNGVNSDQFIVVKLDDEQYGFPIAYVDNIVRFQKPTRVPKTQPYFLGVINIRGEIVPVMSLRLMFNLGWKEVTNSTRIIIINCDRGSKLGIVVDEVREVATLSEQDIDETAVDGNAGEACMLQGVGKYGDTLITLLDINVMLEIIDNG